MAATSGTGFSFGAELRARRLAAGLSLEGLSNRVHYSRSHLSKVENGIKSANPLLARSCDMALNTGGALMALLGRSQQPTPPPTAAGYDDVLIVGLTSPGTSGLGLVSHDDFAAAAGALSGTAIKSATSPTWEDPVVIDGFRTMFDVLRKLGQTVRPVDVLPDLLFNASKLTKMARDARPGVRDDFFRLAARFAENAGWMAQELGNNDLALKWTNWATDLATHGGEDMTAYRLIRLGDMSMYAGDAQQTIEYAQIAYHTSRDPRVRGFAAQRLAHGHALAGNSDECLRNLDLSGELLGKATTADVAQPTVGSSTVADHRAMASGWCLYELGRWSEAADLLSVEVDRLPHHAHRARARYGTRLARCYVAMGDLDRACSTALPVLRLMPSLDSATIRTDVSRLETSLSKDWQHPAVKDLQPFLANARPKVHNGSHN